MLRWHISSWAQLSPDHLYAILQLRQDVFMLEQQCLYPDLDNQDPLAIHVYAETESGGVAAYARIFPPGLHHSQASFGRFCTQVKFRGQGLGKELLRIVLQIIEQEYGPVPIRISAQCYLIDFYALAGFASEGTPYDEDGIPHIQMLRRPEHM